MDAGVASDFVHFAEREPAEVSAVWDALRSASKNSAAARGCGGVGSSTALPLLPDATRIAFVAAPCIRPHGARNAASHHFSAPC